jgi:hypothetical protein
MANLIIKPSSGGSLKLQEDGGTDALTIDASGNTTLAGTANNLGTVTAGSIAGGSITSATTFPAGMIRQAKSGSIGDLAQDSGSRAAPNTISFDTAKLSTSDVLVQYSYVYIPRSTTANTTAYCDVRLTGSNYGATTSGLKVGNYIAYNIEQHHMRLHYFGSIMDTNPTTTPAYGLYFHQNTGSTTYEIDSTNNHSSITIFEILSS